MRRRAKRNKAKPKAKWSKAQSKQAKAKQTQQPLSSCHLPILNSIRPIWVSIAPQLHKPPYPPYLSCRLRRPSTLRRAENKKENTFKQNQIH